MEALINRLSINSNISSLRAQRDLSNANANLEGNFARLSSGLRINKVSDDSAALAVATGLHLDDRIFRQGIRNFNDGISHLAVADSALGEMSSVLMRIQEIAEQSANGTLTNSQRDPLQKEAYALQEEYNRILKTTKFNGTSILTGANTFVKLQGGYGNQGQIAFQVGSSTVSDAFGEYAAGQTYLLSTNAAGASSTGTVSHFNTNADGKKVSFVSDASDIISGVTGTQAYVKDLETGVVTLGSSLADGSPSTGVVVSAAISQDGQYLVFNSDATDLIPGVTGDQVYIKNLTTGALTLGSSTSSGLMNNGSNAGGGLTADNRYLLFTSNATNMVAGSSGSQMFRKDLHTGEVLAVNRTGSGTFGSGGSRGGISDDGRYVAFHTDSVELTGLVGEQIYLKDFATGEVNLISSDSSGTAGNASSTQSNISADGRYVIFRSSATNLVSGGTTGSEIFRKDIQTGAVLLVSSGSDGTEGNGFSQNPSISADGRFVVFSSTSSNYVSGASGDQFYRKDLESGSISLVSRSTNGTVASMTAPTITPRMSKDGRYMFFASDAANLTDGDSNGTTDLFMRDMSTAGVQELSGMTVNSQGSARVTLEMASNYLEEISLVKAGIGASNSRVNSAVSHLSVVSENFSSAVSQIRDADIASESAMLISNKIRSQSAEQALKHINLEPELVLQLLQ